MLSYAKDHPVFEGHFPGHPVIPAALILAETVEAASMAWPHRRVLGVASAKFFAPLGPETDVELCFLETARGLGFVIKHASITFAKGTLILGDDEN